MNNTQRIIKYFKHNLTGRNAKGFGIHSPFIFHLVTEIINDFTPFYCYSQIEKERSKLTSNKDIINIHDLGSGHNNGKQKISDLSKRSLKNKKQAQLLFRLVNHLNAKNILELGTSFGITTSYLASVAKQSKVVSLEGCPQTAAVAKNTFANLNLENIEVIVGNISETLPDALNKLPNVDFVFFDANHNKQATLSYFNICLKHINNESVFIFDDIHLNKEMEAAWNEIKQHDSVKVTLDLYHLGIVFFRKEFTKQHFNIKFW